jgi:hypothetical protein
MVIQPSHPKSAWPSLRHLDSALNQWALNTEPQDLCVLDRALNLDTATVFAQLASCPGRVLIRGWGDVLWSAQAWKSWEPALLGRQVCWVAASQSHARLMECMTGQSALVAPYPIASLKSHCPRDEFLATQGIPSHKRIVLYLGRKGALKGLRDAWQAWIALGAEDVVFVQVGRWEEGFTQAGSLVSPLSALRNESERLKTMFPESFFDFPECDRVAATSWLVAAEMVVAPGVYPEEDGALSLREALALGKKVIASAWGVHRDFPARKVSVEIGAHWPKLADLEWRKAVKEVWSGVAPSPWWPTIPSVESCFAHAKPFNGFSAWTQELALAQQMRGTRWLVDEGKLDDKLWRPQREAMLGTL